MQADFTAMAPKMVLDTHARFFVQYTAYDKFNGLSKNYDGTGRNASDNNTLFLGTWLTF